MELFGMPPPEDPGGADSELARRIAEAMAADDRFRRQPLAVQVQNGVVILTGRVESPEIYDEITAEVRQTPGVRDLCDGILVADGEARLREARQFGELAARLATEPARGTRRGSPAAIAARMVMIGVTVVVVLIEIVGWIAAVFGVGLLAWVADILLRHRKR
ncbi:BON domain-containing protein [Actinoplanes sp. LDG1-06]|uniref:BON domain-containing protein n=1 Tax=Paractinoplanes ovalisporus TaxID=2810368 RepID=A0ABS2A5N5_9ACTN|nr:BON domain-containing protein [Actinoplanes ovalisporus]MBM2614556.1 BON domain-containing protein [Actinoplanes ovalisporus]